MAMSACYSSFFGRPISFCIAGFIERCLITGTDTQKSTIEDPRLRPILEKVEAGERLTYEDGVTLYRSHDLLALGYMANMVRERMHGDVTYFNVNRHINPTDVCVASCRLVRVRQASKGPDSLHDVARAGVGDRRARAMPKR